MDSHDKKDMLSSLTLLCSFGPEKQFMKRTLGRNGFLKIHHMLVSILILFLLKIKILSVC